MNEAETEQRIEQCRAAGLGADDPAPGLRADGPGIELNRLAELPVLDFRFSDPPRSTMAIKRAMDLVVSASCWRCSPPARCSPRS